MWTGSGQLPSGPAALDDAQSYGQPRPHCTPATPLAPRPTHELGREARAPGAGRAGRGELWACTHALGPALTRGPGSRC